MKLKRCQIFVWSLLLCLGGNFGCVTGSSNAKSSIPFQMEVSLQKPLPQVYALFIRITNPGPTIREVESLDLPWKHFAIQEALTITRLDAQRSLVEQGGPLINYGGSQSIPLQPGESIEGKWILNPYSPTLLQDVAAFGVNIHWRCFLPDIQVTCPQGSGGSFIIPKGDPGLPDLIAIDQDICEQSRQAIRITQVNAKREHLSVLTDLATIKDHKNRMKLLQQIKLFVEKCKPRWTSSWQVSFFNKAGLAGVQSDPQNKVYFEKGIWQAAHIGEYVAETRRFVYFPWDEKRNNEEYLSLFQASN